MGFQLPSIQPSLALTLNTPIWGCISWTLVQLLTLNWTVKEWKPLCATRCSTSWPGDHGQEDRGILNTEVPQRCLLSTLLLLAHQHTTATSDKIWCKSTSQTTGAVQRPQSLSQCGEDERDCCWLMEKCHPAFPGQKSSSVPLPSETEKSQTTSSYCDPKSWLKHIEEPSSKSLKMPKKFKVRKKGRWYYFSSKN